MDDASEPKPKPDLRTRLIDAAEVEIAEKGLAGIKARDVTGRAGCALGAIYNAVADLDELVQRVNSRTLVRLGAALAPAKLQFVGSCNLFEALPNLFCEAPEMALMAAWPEGAPRELLKDLYLPRPFRAARHADAVVADTLGHQAI